jgi:hypothetical protein
VNSTALAKRKPAKEFPFGRRPFLRHKINKYNRIAIPKYSKDRQMVDGGSSHKQSGVSQGYKAKNRGEGAMQVSPQRTLWHTSQIVGHASSYPD